VAQKLSDRTGLIFGHGSHPQKVISIAGFYLNPFLESVFGSQFLGQIGFVDTGLKLAVFSSFASTRSPQAGVA
jgi:hypothetical protein